MQILHEQGLGEKSIISSYTLTKGGSRVARFLAAKYRRLLSIRNVRQGQYLRLLLYTMR